MKATRTTPLVSAQPEPMLVLLLMHLFNLDVEAVRASLRDSRPAVTTAIADLFNGADFPYSAVAEVGIDEHKKENRSLAAKLKALGGDISTQDALDALLFLTGESVAWHGIVLGWHLRGLMAGESVQ